MSFECSNPDCTKAFDYRRGRLFRFHNNRPGPETPEAAGCCVRHFWLCDGCSRTHVLEYHLGLGVVIRPRYGNSPDGEAVPDCLFLSDIPAKCVSRGVIVTCAKAQFRARQPGTNYNKGREPRGRKIPPSAGSSARRHGHCGSNRADAAGQLADGEDVWLYARRTAQPAGRNSDSREASATDIRSTGMPITGASPAPHGHRSRTARAPQRWHHVSSRNQPEPARGSRTVSWSRLRFAM